MYVYVFLLLKLVAYSKLFDLFVNLKSGIKHHDIKAQFQPFFTPIYFFDCNDRILVSQNNDG
jgi:hypothetical protein